MDWGFDLADFEDNGQKWARILGVLEISCTPTLTDQGWLYAGAGVEIVTLYDPLTGARYTSPDRGSVDSEGFVGYIGITGAASTVKALARAIRGGAEIKEESPGSRDFI